MDLLGQYHIFLALTVWFELSSPLTSGFHVGLDNARIQGLQRQFIVLDLPTQNCRSVNRPRDGSEPWLPHCAYGLTKSIECIYNGFQYSMEWYFIQVLRDNEQYSAASAEEATFIYFPQCVSQVYFALRGAYNMTHWEAIEAAETEYLIPLLRWAHDTEVHQRYGGRNFWTVFSMDLGRQDFPRSAPWLETWSIGSLTGAELWMKDMGNFLHDNVGFQTDGCWEEDTSPVTLENDMFPARSFRPHDTVISIPSRFAPEGRSFLFGGRSTLVFFAGSPNSCARRRILEMYSGAPGFDVSTNFKGDADYRERMWNSRFCLVLRGSSHTNNVRLYEVIAHGCIPVVVSDDFQPPLDAWLPWSDMAIFLPTSRIPELGHILRTEVDEAQRWKYFKNIALGIEDAETTYEASLIASAKGELDRATLWSGLSAARIFDWDRSDFWILFLADIQRKLSLRIQK